MSGTPNGAASQSSRAAPGAAPRWTTAAMVAARATSASSSSSSPSPSSSTTPRARPSQTSTTLAPPPPLPSSSSSSSSRAPPSLPPTSTASTSTLRVAPPANGTASQSIAGTAFPNGNSGGNANKSKAPPPQPPQNVTTVPAGAASIQPTLSHKAPSSTPSVSTPTSRNPAAPTRPRQSVGSSSSLSTTATATATPAGPSVSRRDLASAVATDTPSRDAPRRDAAKRETPKVDPPRRETPRRETPKRETPRRDTPKRGETPKSDPVGPTADRSSSVGAAPSVASSSAVGPSSAPNGAAAEDEQQPKKKQKRRGWKGWAVEVIDEYGNKIVRSPSPEPERLPGAPPRPRGRPRTRPQPEPEPKPEPAPPDQAAGTQPADGAGDDAATADAAAVEKTIAMPSPTPQPLPAEAGELDMSAQEELAHDATETADKRQSAVSTKPTRETAIDPARETPSSAAAQDPAPARPALEEAPTSKKEGVKRGRPRESHLSKRRLSTSASPPPSGKRAKPTTASHGSSLAAALNAPDEPTPSPPPRAEPRGPRRSEPGPSAVATDGPSTSSAKAFEAPASVPIQRVNDVVPSHPSTPTPTGTGSRPSKLPKIAPAPLRQLGNGTKSNGRASPAATTAAPNPSSARGKQSVGRDDSSRAGTSNPPGTATPRPVAPESSRVHASKPRPVAPAPSNQRTLDEFTVEKPKAVRGLAGPVYPSPPESDGRDVQMEVDDVTLLRQEAAPRRGKGSTTPRESVPVQPVQSLSRILPAVSDEARFIIEANEKRRELEKRDAERASKERERNDTPQANRPRSSEDGREARHVSETRRRGPQEGSEERGREPPARQQKRKGRPMGDDVVFVEERGQFWNGNDPRREREREERAHRSNGREPSKDRNPRDEYDHRERYRKSAGDPRMAREFEDSPRHLSEQWERGVETQERREPRDYRDHPDRRIIRDREVRGHFDAYRTDPRNVHEERDHDSPNWRHHNYPPPPQNGPYSQPYQPTTAYPAGYPQQYAYHPPHPAQFTPPLPADPVHRPRQMAYPPDAPPVQYSPRPRSEGSEWPFPATRTSAFDAAVRGPQAPPPRAQPSPAAAAAPGPSRRDAAPPPVTAVPPPLHVAPSCAPVAPSAGYRPTSAPSLSYVDVVPVPFPTGPPYVAPEPRAPSHLSDAAPQIILAPRGNEPPMPTSRTDLPWARLHANGFEGLDPSLDENARGFVENVKNNLRTLVSTYFVEPSHMRDAFLESIGRDLVDLGWQLTDGSDGALYSRGAPKP